MLWGAAAVLTCQLPPPPPHPFAATCLVLAAAMGQRANRSGKVLPAGLISILSALMTAGYARSLA